MLVGDKLISGAKGDGVHFLDFHGDLTTDYNPKHSITQTDVSKHGGHSKTSLDRIMRSVAQKSKAAKV